MSDTEQDQLDRDVLDAVTQADFALAPAEVARRLGRGETEVTDALNRLVQAGKMKVTADRTSRAYYCGYYVDPRQLP